MTEVNKVLEEIGAKDIPQLLVFNKIDLEGRSPFITCAEDGTPKAVGISAANGEGIESSQRRHSSNKQKKSRKSPKRLPIMRTGSLNLSGNSFGPSLKKIGRD